MDELDTAVAALEADRTVQAVILTGAGGTFISGGDLKSLETLEGIEAGRSMSRKMQAILLRLEGLEVPVIAAIEGYALGGGAEVAMACDIRIAASDARIGFKQITMGIMVGWGGGQRLRALVGRGRALELLLTGDIVTGEEAHHIGIVERVAPSGKALAEAEVLARQVAAQPPLAVRDPEPPAVAAARRVSSSSIRYVMWAGTPSCAIPRSASSPSWKLRKRKDSNALASGARWTRIVACVITPRAPSDPTARPRRSGPIAWRGRDCMSYTPDGATRRRPATRSSIFPYRFDNAPEDRDAIHPPRVENSKLCGKCPTVRPCAPSSSSSSGPRIPACAVARRDISSTARTRRILRRSIVMWGRDASTTSTPPTTLVPPPNGITRTSFSEQNSRSRRMSSSPSGNRTRSGGGGIGPSRSRIRSL